LHGRPECNNNNIFLRTHRPHTKLNGQSLWTIFSKYSIPELGKSIGKKHGPHAFRRGIGARMLGAEIPHTVMSDVLGHSVPDALTYYTAVSLNGLRLCAGTLDDIPVTREELL
jgi:integrase